MDDRRAVVDASAVMAWVAREVGAETVAQLLPYAVLPVPNAVEVLVAARRRNWDGSDAELLRDITAMGVRLEQVEPDDALRAAELVSVSRDVCGERISLGDGLCLAVAERLGLPVVGGDSAWAGLPLRVKFLRFR